MLMVLLYGIATFAETELEFGCLGKGSQDGNLFRTPG